ncbi:sedoheptulose-1,7-bisphosphatase, chloroplastic [Artemisia annua]|uniref:Sedoheptulose-1,7-bisphosphatase, chloroplastic n=1 Tax=Artemisia annua TaxID=35608 RepID=A0A2U1LVP5_ARTAN|nr:sedoheptulose-1,7-bisphosphatase, chloroplastic [Artemisia annua]
MMHAQSLTIRISKKINFQSDMMHAQSLTIRISKKDGRFSVTFDPLHESSIVDTNFTVDTIFGVWLGDKLTGMTGGDQVAAAMGIYGPRTTYIFPIKGFPGTHKFILLEEVYHSNKWQHVKETTGISEGKMFSPGNLIATFDNLDYDKIIVRKIGVFPNAISPATKAKLRLLFRKKQMLVYIMAAACIFVGFINVWYFDDPHNITLIDWIRKQIFIGVWHSEKVGFLQAREMRMTLAWCWHSKIQDRFLDEEETQVYLGVKRFSSCELQVATDNFSVKNIYRRGGFEQLPKKQTSKANLNPSEKALAKSSTKVNGNKFSVDKPSEAQLAESEQATYASSNNVLKRTKTFQDVPGLYNLAMAIVDYRGHRSVLPGILQGDKLDSLLYGSVDNGKKVCWNEDFHAKALSFVEYDSALSEDVKQQAKVLKMSCSLNNAACK